MRIVIEIGDKTATVHTTDSSENSSAGDQDTDGGAAGAPVQSQGSGSDFVASNSPALDAGSPPEWLLQAIGEAYDHDPDRFASATFQDQELQDGGGGPDAQGTDSSDGDAESDGGSAPLSNEKEG